MSCEMFAKIQILIRRRKRRIPKYVFQPPSMPCKLSIQFDSILLIHSKGGVSIVNDIDYAHVRGDESCDINK